MLKCTDRGFHLLCQQDQDLQLELVFAKANLVLKDMSFAISSNEHHACSMVRASAFVSFSEMSACFHNLSQLYESM